MWSDSGKQETVKSQTDSDKKLSEQALKCQASCVGSLIVINFILPTLGATWQRVQIDNEKNKLLILLLNIISLVSTFLHY